MKQRLATCPACGGPVEFKSGATLVTICEFCQSVVARGDKAPEEHGKVADLVQTNSHLTRGQTGKFRGKSFEVTGRVQYQHPAGGVWDEWYLTFSNNKVGWVAEAQGKIYLTFEQELRPESPVPDFESLQVGDELRIGKGYDLTITETGTATTGAAEGEIPWDFRPGRPHQYADLQDSTGAFGTLDFSESPPRFYYGREIPLTELELSKGGYTSDMPPAPNTAALQVNCPNCGGPLTLRVPDETQHVGCPNCRSLLDCQKGNLRYLGTLKFAPEKLVIPIGSVGTFRGDQYTVIGVMGRYAKWENKTFPWTEYLLYNPKVGFRWLVENDNHWSFVEPISPAEAKEKSGSILYKGDRFKVYDRGHAFVRWVLGEFYWKVQAGERVQTADYIAPPRMISVELSQGAKSKEINASLGTYLPVEEVEQAFGLHDLRRPWVVGTIQPKPEKRPVMFLTLIFVAVLTLINLVFSSVKTSGVSQGYFLLSMLGLAAFPIVFLFYCHHIEVQRWRDSDYSPYATEE